MTTLTSGRNQGGVARIRKAGESWRRLSIALLPDEVDDFERERGEFNRGEFVMRLLKLWKITKHRREKGPG